jgi:divalent metal cation (Fe/Co/Zn/Cd) transporter
MSLLAAHEHADRLEEELRSELAVAEAHVHIEPRHEEAEALVPVSDPAIELMVVRATSEYGGIHDIEVLASPNGQVIRLHCYLPGDMPVAEAHAVTADIEKVIRESVPGAYRVTVHPEPKGE